MESSVCRICTAPIISLHLGVEACRACANFFKRTVVAKRKFACRQGDRNCEIKQHDKFMCRSCRYDNCIRLGMKYEDPKKKHTRKLDEECEEEAISGSSSAVLSDETSIIDRMEAAYKASYERRLVQEKEYVVGHNLPPFNHPTQELFLANLTAFYDLYQLAIKETSGILQNVFDGFGNIPIEQRVTLFKNFFVKLSMIEGFYFTSKYLKNSKMQMASLITCGDMNDPDQWMIETTEIKRKDAFRASAKGFINEYTDMFASMAKMDDLTEREFYALLVLGFCDINPSLQLPEEIIENAEKTRARVFKELQDYYRNELNLHDFSRRLGNLMTIAHSAGVAGVLHNEEQRMYATMFDVCSEDRLLKEFFTD